MESGMTKIGVFKRKTPLFPHNDIMPCAALQNNDKLKVRDCQVL
jgi:hypothetical protein